MELRELVTEQYGQLEKCYGHCELPATAKFLNDDAESVVVGYSCHGAYLSRIIIYSKSLTLPVSVNYVTRLVKGQQEVMEEDVRIASRYPWDLNMVSTETEKIMMMGYWTQNYRRTKNDDPNRNALFLCESCHTIYSQPVTSKHILCPRCTSERPPS
jgi:hypothetical protein